MNLPLKEFLQALSVNERTRLAEQCETSIGHLNNCAYNEKTNISPKLAVLLEQATFRSLTRQELRPDDFAQIWPELV